jgi:hypothetical protein
MNRCRPIVGNITLVIVHFFHLQKPLKRNGGREKVGILFGMGINPFLAVFQKIKESLSYANLFVHHGS